MPPRAATSRPTRSSTSTSTRSRRRRQVPRQLRGRGAGRGPRHGRDRDLRVHRSDGGTSTVKRDLRVRGRRHHPAHGLRDLRHDATDGTYLVVRDRRHGGDGADPSTTSSTRRRTAAAGRLPGRTACRCLAAAAPSTRTFTRAAARARQLLKDPLWYAAKWGGFEDENGNATACPDKRPSGTPTATAMPDNYFLVTNALKLSEQLSKAFTTILDRVRLGVRRIGEQRLDQRRHALYQAKFTHATGAAQLSRTRSHGRPRQRRDRQRGRPDRRRRCGTRSQGARAGRRKIFTRRTTDGTGRAVHAGRRSMRRARPSSSATDAARARPASTTCAATARGELRNGGAFRDATPRCSATSSTRRRSSSVRRRAFAIRTCSKARRIRTRPSARRRHQPQQGHLRRRQRRHAARLRCARPARSASRSFRARCSATCTELTRPDLRAPVLRRRHADHRPTRSSAATGTPCSSAA